MSEFEEGAKAAQEVARLGTEATKAGREAGAFLARIFGAPLEQASGWLEDRLLFNRAMQRMDLMDRFEKQRAKLGISGPLEPVPLKFGFPLLEAAALEEDPDLRDMMATLLANATNLARSEEPRAAFAYILGQMEPLDAKVLLAAYNSPPSNPGLLPFKTAYTAGLPDRLLSVAAQHSFETHDNPPTEVEVSLWNLVRLGCLAPSGMVVQFVTVTSFGAALLKASTLPEQRTGAA